MGRAPQEASLLRSSLKNHLDSGSIPLQGHLKHQAINPALPLLGEGESSLELFEEKVYLDI